MPGLVLVGGFLGHELPADPDGYSPRADPDWTRDVLAVAGRVFGVVDHNASVRHGWAGLYPTTPGRHPIIDRLADGLYAALGFSGTGLMHAPAAGQLIGQLILDGEISSVDSAPFGASRFSAPVAAEHTGS